MLDRETALRSDKRLTNRLAASKLRFPDACIEKMIITGQTGTGKTWLACAFGRQAARLDHSILYLRMPRLLKTWALPGSTAAFHGWSISLPASSC